MFRQPPFSGTVATFAAHAIRYEVLRDHSLCLCEVMVRHDMTVEAEGIFLWQLIAFEVSRDLLRGASE